METTDQIGGHRLPAGADTERPQARLLGGRRLGGGYPASVRTGQPQRATEPCLGLSVPTGLPHPLLKFSGGSVDDYATIPDDSSSPS